MYSVVLMMALSSGAEVPDCHRSNSCYGGGGCYGGYVSSGCYGGGGHGCHGGGLFGRKGGGCYGGGCYGMGYGGCYGMGYGGCHGMGYGGCYGGGIIIHGGYGCMGGKPDMMPGKDKDKDKDKGKDGKVGYSAPATIVVSLPADAKLTIDGNATISTSATRRFESPTLASGRDFHYTLKAEFVREGKPVVVSETITVRAGEETHVTLKEPAVSIAQK